MANEHKTDILIVGAGLGGIAAALSALEMGFDVILVEESDWIGGQLTAQAVPPDENPWIDSHQTGCTASYRKLRDHIRSTYRHFYPLTPSAMDNPLLNPGMGNVSKLCHEPKVGLHVLTGMLAPYLSNGKLQLILEHRPVHADVVNDRIENITFTSMAGEHVLVSAHMVIDATELGDVLPLAGIEHVLGAESQAQTGEMHARSDGPDPLDQQAISWCFALDYVPGEDHTIEKPEDYDFWVSYQADFWPDRQLSWVTPDPVDLRPVYRPIFKGPRDAAIGDDLWHFRRVLFKHHFQEGFFGSDITLVNWPQIDYWLGPLVGVSEEEKEQHLRGARQLSLSLLYWMQTEAPREDGGLGYPGLRLRGDLLGTDGLAKTAYIRESRRIQAEFTVLESHIGVEQRGDLRGSETFFDSVGIGSYRIDLHPSTAGRTYIDIPSWPFQIPLGALLPVRVTNLLPACKNIGTTHITNGCYRLHPVEWNIGEAAGALAAFSLQKKITPHQTRSNPALLEEFQLILTNQLGFILSWPEELCLEARDKLDPLGY
jgi:hypothetical protein